MKAISLLILGFILKTRAAILVTPVDRHSEIYGITRHKGKTMKALLLLLALSTPSAFAQTLSIHNPNTDIKVGETAEYSTLENILKEMEGAGIVIGVGEAFPSVDKKIAHEVFVLKTATELRALQSSEGTGTAETLNLQTPLTFSVFASMDPNTAVEMIYDKPEQAGRVLWNFRIDETARFGGSFHTSYSGTDNKATETLFNEAVNSRKSGFNAEKARSNLVKYIPALAKDPKIPKDTVWNQFKNSIASTELEKTWLSVMRDPKNKWTAAAFVIEGSLLDVNHFRVTKVNKVKPGGLTVSKPKDYQLENNSEVSQWTIVGTVVDPEAANFNELQQAQEAFGQGIHFHGVRSDNKKIGHVLTAVLSDKPLTVKLYPLRIGSDLGISNNDLIAAKDATSYSVENKGSNFVRNLKYAITKDNRTLETRDAAVLAPNQKIQVPLKAGECLVVDAEKILVEGGAGRDNNTICAK